MGSAWWEGAPECVHVSRTPATPGERGEFPAWLGDDVVAALAEAGITQPWRHQVEAAEAAYAGRHVALSTGTASGKTLAYLMPIWAATLPPHRLGVELTDKQRALVPRRRPHTALYLAPTKALGHDQVRAARALAPAGWPVVAVDGDSEESVRRWAREQAALVVTNPDLVHHTMLPQHDRWSAFLRGLRYIVVDEAHRYRGVFGAQVALVLRRLRRICAQLGAEPTVVCASATTGNAAEATARLLGVDSADVADVSVDHSARAARTTVLWQPSTSCAADASRLMARLVKAGQQTVTFVTSRALAEHVATQARGLADGAQVVAYRAGYLAADRRRLEAGLQSGRVRGVAATSALELGVDIAGMDAVIMAGFPGTMASLRQQTGRAGRSGRDATAVLVARENPLDQYLLAHPEWVDAAPSEPVVLHPDNPRVLGPHLCAAAQEAPLTEADGRWFGNGWERTAEALAEQGLLRRRPRGWFWPHPQKAAAAIDLRQMGGSPFDIVDGATGQVVGQVDDGAVDRTVFPGAVYVHQGQTWLVTELDRDAREAVVKADRPGYITQPLGLHEVSIVTEHNRKALGRGVVCWGEVEIRGRVTGYLRRDEHTLDVWDSTPLEMPEHRMVTEAMWWLVGDDVLQRAGLADGLAGEAAHAAEHTAIGLLPLFAPCDRWDIGGLSTAVHADTGMCTIFVHDGHKGGAGFARAGWDVAEAWWRSASERLGGCGCDDGCPKCCISPKCGNANQHVDKAGGAALLRALLP